MIDAPTAVHLARDLRLPATVQLRAAGLCVVVHVPDDGAPVVLHWGADLGELDGPALDALRLAAVPPVPRSALDEPWWLTLLPGEADGWSGRPGVAGSVAGRAVVPRWTATAARTEEADDGGRRLVVRCTDEDLALAVTSELRLEASGLLRVRHELERGADATGVLDLDRLDVLLPVPAEATELLDLTGRWTRERSPQRQPFTLGTRLRETRRGRTGHDAPVLLVAQTAGAGFRRGEVWGAHVAWSGDQVHAAERLPERAGQASGVLGGGELLRPGEVRLAAGQSYATPWVAFTWSDEGLDGASARVHRWLRARPHHPRAPRPLVLNTWEAVYFDHDLDRLRQLADVAAAVGVERFVLDDGWFGSRRDDTSGLGDWYVSTEVWPQGLHPLVEHVRGLGLQVGLWFEPEMVNPDSDLLRAHPDWVLAAGRPPRAWRGQQVLDLARPEVAAHLLERLDALVGEYRLDFLKWDHNRDLHEAVHAPTGAAGVHAQTVALYALLDALRARHPGLEIESCASGGARVDLGVLERADRVWASDTNDAVERQQIQRWTQLLLPPELVGGHVGPAVSHTTGRHVDLSFRCLTALFGHAGFEWDLTGCTPAELERVTAWAALYKELRPLLHGGDVVRADSPDDGAWVHGVVAADRGEAALAYVRLGTSPEALPGRVRLPGLDPARRYRVRRRDEVGPPGVVQSAPPAWWDAGELTATGAVLGGAGLQLPVLQPAQGLLLHLTPAEPGDIR